MDYKKNSEILKALGHPTRLRMVQGLINDECNVSRIMEVLNIPQSTTSQHLGVLRNSGIIEAKKDGVKACYKIVDERVKKIISILNKE